MAEGTKGHVKYTLGSRVVTDLLHSLSKLKEERGSNLRVAALVNPHLLVEEIWTIDGTAGKAQLTNVRFFVFVRDTGTMSEIRLLPLFPFQRVCGQVQVIECGDPRSIAKGSDSIERDLERKKNGE